MKIAVCQMAGDAGNVADRLSAIEMAARQAVTEGARIAVFPELATTGYGAGEDIKRLAEPLDGPTVSKLRAMASDLDIAIVAGVPLIEEGSVFNAAVFAAPDGALENYAKIQLYGDYEKDLFAPGTEPSPIIEYEGMHFGLLVCFDVEFPERVRDLAQRGADAVLVPTALPDSAAGAFIAASVLPVRAFENQLFIAYANHTGRDGRFTYQGCSCIAAPDGALLARASAENAQVIVADCDPAAYEASRVQNPYLDELRKL